MKYKVVLMLTLLVLGSLITFSNKCRSTCDGRTMIVMNTEYATDNESSIIEEEPGSSPLLRMAITL